MRAAAAAAAASLFLLIQSVIFHSFSLSLLLLLCRYWWSDFPHLFRLVGYRSDCANCPARASFPAKQSAVVAAGNVTIYLRARGDFPNLPASQPAFTSKPPTSVLFIAKDVVGNTRQFRSKNPKHCWIIIKNNIYILFFGGEKNHMSTEADGCWNVWETDWSLSSVEVRNPKKKIGGRDEIADWLCWSFGHWCLRICNSAGFWRSSIVITICYSVVVFLTWWSCANFFARLSLYSSLFLWSFVMH